ncbi:hypothetical protein [Propylenella binzhouense]|nr:hypothetical protein [Propylenella binzhouense]
MLARIVRAVSAGFRTIRDRFASDYHPERHYMRGPGPMTRRAQHGRD